mgnify:CR=1 FL=1
MSQSIVPVKIRKHLIPFFYKEFKGKEAFYLDKKVKACKINMTSSIGKMFRITLEKSDYPVKVEKFNMYISISDNVVSGQMYQCVSGQYSFLKVPEKVAEDLNDILEDQFRIAFVYTVQTAIKYAPNLKIKDIISDFMIEYKLDEYGYRLESMRTLYNREISKNNKMSRMQSKASNRVLNYKN